MLPRPLRSAQGLHIQWLYSDFNEDPLWVGLTLPDETKILTFDIGDWLVLDPYGDDAIPNTIRARIFGDPDGDNRQFTLAVHRKTGELAFANYFIDDDDDESHSLGYTPAVMRAPKHSIAVQAWMPESYILPPEYVARLDELVGKKRPFRASFDSTSLLDFIDRETGYSDLKNAVVFTFDFDGEYLQITDDCHRVVSGWVRRPPTPDDYECPDCFGKGVIHVGLMEEPEVCECRK